MKSFFLKDKAIDNKSLNWIKISNNIFLNFGSLIILGILYDIKYEYCLFTLLSVFVKIFLLIFLFNWTFSFFKNNFVKISSTSPKSKSLFFFGL